MAIAGGTQLGPYEIVAPIGAGGMGEVYRAKDTRLDRPVAIKVLPQHLSSQPELRERFEREARTISALNHPNICILHDIGRQDGIEYLVMEYLEGETLAKRLEKGSLPIDQVLKYSIEIADALDKAHRQGITHRDLKPGNIMITANGAKLLDFGLAKFRQAEKPERPDKVLGASPSLLPTQASQLTMQGTILGTLQYMSPEQLEGREADARSDLFALGAVMYEMLTGRKAFEGKSQASLIAAIIHVDPPPVSVLQPVTPPALDRIVRKCLVKDPDERWQTARDLVDELRWISEGSHSGSVSAAAPAARAAGPAARRGRLSLVIAAFFFLCTIALGAWILLHREPRTFGMVRVEIDPPEKNAFPIGAASQFAISADGRMLAFSAVGDRKALVWVRPFDAPVSQPLTQSVGGQFPFWSPDGHYIGFFADSKLKKIEVTGGAPFTLSNIKVAYGGTWNSKGTILFVPDFSSGIFRVSENGGDPVQVTTIDAKRERAHMWPQFLPDGRHFIYLAVGIGSEPTGIYVGSLDGGTPKLVVRSQIRAAYGSGYLLFVRENVLMAQPFDLKQLTLTGEPTRVAEQIGTNLVTGQASYIVSESGIIGYRTGGLTGNQQQLIWFDRQGKQSVVVTENAQYRTHELSPDGKRVVAHRHDAGTSKGDLWIIELERGLTTRLTFDNSHSFAPVWSPDGSKIVYASVKDGTAVDLYQKLSSGAANEELLFRSPDNKHPVDWSSDGRFILYESTNDGQPGSDLWVLPLFGDKKPIPFLKTPFNERKGRFSPDGKWIAYTSNESGTDQIYIQPFPPNGGKWQISTNGGFEPRWRADGKELYYLNNQDEEKLMAVSIKWSTIPEPGAPQELMPRGNGWYGVDNANQYVASADGQRFLFVRNVETPSNNPARDSITVLINWLAGLKR